jgi:hypothetical protein
MYFILEKSSVTSSEDMHEFFISVQSWCYQRQYRTESKVLWALSLCLLLLLSSSSSHVTASLQLKLMTRVSIWMEISTEILITGLEKCPSFLYHFRNAFNDLSMFKMPTSVLLAQIFKFLSIRYEQHATGGQPMFALFTYLSSTIPA